MHGCWYLEILYCHFPFESFEKLSHKHSIQMQKLVSKTLIVWHISFRLHDSKAWNMFICISVAGYLMLGFWRSNPFSAPCRILSLLLSWFYWWKILLFLVSDGRLRLYGVISQLYITTVMTALVILNNLSWLIPSAIAFILCHDLLLNQSALSQYFHWISFLLMGISTASISSLYSSVTANFI